MINYDALLGRADDDTLQRLIGTGAVKLLNLLDPTLARPSQLRRLIIGFRTPAEVLRDPVARQALFLLLPPADAAELTRVLDLDPADPYLALAGVTVRRGSRRERALLSALGIDTEDVPSPDASPTCSDVSPSYQLFAHQRRTARDVLEHLEVDDNRRVLLHMPTGAGKTRTSMHVVADFLRHREPALVTWLAYSEELCEQAAAEFESAWAALGDRDLHVYRYFGARNIDFKDIRDGLVVSGLDKISALLRRDLFAVSRLAGRTGLTVLDEAHHAMAPTYNLILRFLVGTNPQASLLGLSATPGRSYNNVELDEQLADFFHRSKVTLTVDGYDNPIDYLIEEGYLARPVFHSLPFEPTGLTTLELAGLAESLEVPTAVLERLAVDEQRNLLIVERVEDLVQRHSRVLVFAATVEHSRLLAMVLRARGHEATAVNSATDPIERDRLIRKFRSSSDGSQVLCNYGVLTTGFDAPRTSAAVIARPTGSLVLYSQMVGRALRGRKAGGNDTAEIWTIVDTIMPGFGSMAEAFVNWEDVWQ